VKAFGDEQWGSRTGRSATAVVLQNHFTDLMMNLTKTDGVTFDNDAAACFDRIISALTNFQSQQLRMPRSACHMHSELLRKASYVLKTGAGISEQAYSSTEAHLWRGPRH
jgi:hypothetical protein